MESLGKSFARVLVLACTSLLLGAVPASADYEQNFDSLASSGWTTKNLSSWTDISGWMQADAPNTQPPAHSTHLWSYATYLDPWEAGNHLSDWLISPTFSTLSNGDVVNYSMFSGPFWFGHPGHDDFEMRLATGASCSPGTTAQGVGDFTTRLLTVDPQAFGLPVTSAEIMAHSINPQWSQHSAVIRGLPDGNHSGCIGLRRTNPDDYWAVNSMGLDDFSIREDASPPGGVEFYPNWTEGTEYEWTHYPLLRGRADPGSTVSFFSNATCSGDAFETASSDQFDWPGVRVFYEVKDVPFTVSARASNGTDAGECKSEGLSYLWDTLPPETVDDVGDTGNTYPGPVKLSATDSGYGVDKTYYTMGMTPATPTRSSAVYNPAAPPIVAPYEKVSYFSVDRSGNAEDVKTSGVAPVPPHAPAPAVVEAKGKVAANEKRPALVRPASSSLVVHRGRVAVTLVCRGGSRASDCSGRVSLAARLGSAYKRIAPNAVGYSLAAGSTKLIKLSVSSAARSYIGHSRNKSIWARVQITPDAVRPAEEFSFRRKLIIK